MGVGLGHEVLESCTHASGVAFETAGAWNDAVLDPEPTKGKTVEFGLDDGLLQAMRLVQGLEAGEQGFGSLVSAREPPEALQALAGSVVDGVAQNMSSKMLRLIRRTASKSRNGPSRRGRCTLGPSRDERPTDHSGRISNLAWFEAKAAMPAHSYSAGWRR